MKFNRIFITNYTIVLKLVIICDCKSHCQRKWRQNIFYGFLEFQLTPKRKKKKWVRRCKPLFSGDQETFIETFLRLFQFVFKCGYTVTALPVLIFRASTGSWKRTGRTQSLIYVLTKYIKRRGIYWASNSRMKKGLFCIILFWNYFLSARLTGTRRAWKKHSSARAANQRSRRARRVIKRWLVKWTKPNGRSHIINPTEINQALVSCHIFVRADQWIWNFGDQPWTVVANAVIQ